MSALQEPQPTLKDSTMSSFNLVAMKPENLASYKENLEKAVAFEKNNQWQHNSLNPVTMQFAKELLLEEPERYWQHLKNDPARYNGVRKAIFQRWEEALPEIAKSMHIYFPQESKPPYGFLQTREEYAGLFPGTVRLKRLLGHLGDANVKSQVIRLNKSFLGSSVLDDPLFRLLQENHMTWLTAPVHERQHLFTSPRKPISFKEFISYDPNTASYDKRQTYAMEQVQGKSFHFFQEIISFSTTASLGLESNLTSQQISDHIIKFYTKWPVIVLTEDEKAIVLELTKNIALLEVLGIPPMAIPAYIRMKIGPRFEEKQTLKNVPFLWFEDLALWIEGLRNEKMSQLGYNTEDGPLLVAIAELRREHASLVFEKIAHQVFMEDIINNRTNDQWWDLPIDKQNRSFRKYIKQISEDEWITIYQATAPPSIPDEFSPPKNHSRVRYGSNLGYSAFRIGTLGKTTADDSTLKSFTQTPLSDVEKEKYISDLSSYLEKTENWA